MTVSVTIVTDRDRLIVADVFRLVILDDDVFVLLGVDVDLLLPLFVLEADLVEIRQVFRRGCCGS